MPTVVFTGAGLSTESGIPDFRSPGGVWDRFDPMEFTIERFHADPLAFWQRRVRLISAMDYLDATPNVAHEAIAEAVRNGRVSYVVTQNVDGLHAKAGTPADRLIEVHGNGSRVVCMDCGRHQDVQALLDDGLQARLEADPPEVPRCGCGGVLKPDVVLFGEPVTAMPDALAAVATCDHLLVAGTSLQVYPAAGIVDEAHRLGIPITICNQDPTAYDALATVRRGPVTQSVPAALDALGSA